MFLAILSLRMRRNSQNTTSGFKMDFGFGTGMPENLYVGKFSPKTAFLGVFSDFVTAHAQKRPEYYFPVLKWILDSEQVMPVELYMGQFSLKTAFL